MSDAYANVVGGGLKLKGGGITKKKKKAAENLETSLALSESAQASSSSSADAARKSAPPPRHTETERRRLEELEKRQLQLAADGKLKTHRDKVRDFNKYLSNLTEHYDMPKVSKGN